MSPIGVACHVQPLDGHLDAVLKGDVNHDGAIDNLDITPFVAALASEDQAGFISAFPEGSYAAADVDMSGSPDNLDITPFIGLLTTVVGDSAAIPEPASLMLLMLSLIAMHRTRIRSG